MGGFRDSMIEDGFSDESEYMEYLENAALEELENSDFDIENTDSDVFENIENSDDE